jgi:hypothetical protein
MTKGTRRRAAVATMNTLWAAALGIVLAIVFGFYSINKYGELSQGGLHFLVILLALFLTTILLFARYLTATHHELDLLADYVDGSSLRVGRSVYYSVFLLAGVFGALIAWSHLILVYTAVLLVYNIADLWAAWLVRQNITPLFQKKLSQHISLEEREIVGVIQSYYLGNPTLERAASLMFADWIGFSFALAFHYTKIVWYRDLAYLIVILNLLAGEYVIYRWRSKRDRQITQIEESAANA